MGGGLKDVLVYKIENVVLMPGNRQCLSRKYSTYFPGLEFQLVGLSRNLDLSEQDLVSCSGAGGCEGGSSIGALEYSASLGITTEDCFPYKERESFCDEKCSKWRSKTIKTSGQKIISNPTTQNVKESLIKNGPLSVGYPYWGTMGHGLVLVGYQITASRETIWIFKNSWGIGFGDNGYFKTAGSPNLWEVVMIATPLQIAHMPNLEINCEDVDKDGFCNWGISEIKPTSCSNSCKEGKDWDDSDPDIGDSLLDPWAPPDDIMPPSIGELSPTVFYVDRQNTLSVSASDNLPIT